MAFTFLKPLNQADLKTSMRPLLRFSSLGDYRFHPMNHPFYKK